MVYWAAFIVLSLIIFLAGKNLVKYGDILAEKLNLGRNLIGLVLIAATTSLPELITDISAASWVNAPDLVAGDIFGSCMINLLYLALLDWFVKRQPLTTKVHYGFTLSSAFGILLITLAGISLLLKDSIPSIKWVSVSSFIIILVYLIALKLTTDYERRLISSAVKEAARELRYEKYRLRDVSIKYLINAIFIVFAASILPDVGHKIAVLYGLTDTFFGSLFVALTTSLPEFSVSIAAIRMDLVQIAVANLLGSNIFNIFILAVTDIFYIKGSIFKNMSLINLIPASFSVLMTAVIIVGLIYRAEKKFFKLAYESIALVLIYIIGMFFIYFSF